jgi:LysR family transcriptional regulator of gallate degradation
MDLRQLDYFLAVARHRSITGAASAMNVAQPSLTKSIHLLEAELGVTLFTRLPRGVELTEYGASLLRHAGQIRIQLRDARAEISAMRAGSLGQVAVGAGPSWLRRHLPRAIARVAAGHPQLRVRVVGGFDEALITSLRHGELDFVVAELPSDAAGDLHTTPLTQDDLSVCCAKSHKLAARKSPGIGDLLEHPWVLPPSANLGRQRLEALFITAGLPPPVPVVESQSQAMLLALLADMPALSYTTTATLRLPEARGIVAIDVAGMRAARTAGIIQRRGSFVTPAAQILLDALARICAQDGRN